MFRGKNLRRVCRFMLFSFLFELTAPAFALSGGPSSPEFSSFTPVATSDMVNLSSGDFNYNLPVVSIPGPDGSGYSLGLSYNSGATCEDEASWVGFGWTLNPGAITRNMRGAPDDSKGQTVWHYNRSMPNTTASVSARGEMEFFSKDQVPADHGDNPTKGTGDLTVSASTSLRFNNNQGYARTYGFGIGVKGLASMDMNVSTQGVTFSPNISPLKWMTRKKRIAEAKVKKQEAAKKQKDALTKTQENKAEAQKKADEAGKTTYSFKPASASLQGALSANGSGFGFYSFADEAKATMLPRMNPWGISVNYSFGTTLFPFPAPIGTSLGISGSYDRKSSQEAYKLEEYGLMYSKHAEDDDAKDYQTEKQGILDPLGLYLGIPHQNADAFSVSGEGLGGGFRYLMDNPTYFSPAEFSNKNGILNIGVDLDGGALFGIGINLGFGYNCSKLSRWSGGTGYASDPKGRFRMNMDPGGEHTLGTTAKPNSFLACADLDGVVLIPGAMKFDFDDGLDEYNLETDLTKRHTGYASTYIRQYMNNNSEDVQVMIQCGGGVSTDPNGHTILGFGITDPKGKTYTYGHRLTNSNQLTLAVDVDGSQVLNNSLVYKKVGLTGDLNLATEENLITGATINTTDHKVIQGEYREAPVYNQFLISQITDPFYQDNNTDYKASNGDNGGWTRFEYTEGINYVHRTPYSGLNYSRGSISSKRDDMGNFTIGKKNLKYLKTIETKTHIAYFVTNQSSAARFNVATGTRLADYLNGTGIPRNDALGVRPTEMNNVTSPASQSVGRDLDHRPEYLEKIVLVAKSIENGNYRVVASEFPVQVVNFVYDYSLCPNLPNNALGNYPLDPAAGNLERSGKLTLRKVWFESGGEQAARVSPYEFDYEYKTDFSPSLTSIYSFLEEFQIPSAQAQNPRYSPYLLDAWGFPQPFAEAREKCQLPGRYQGLLHKTALDDGANQVPQLWSSYDWRNVNNTRNQDPTKTYDPGAWQLKQITLPSGGKILIQYEEKDYAYVQDRKAMTLASLTGVDNEIKDCVTGKCINGKPTYWINPADLGIPKGTNAKALQDAQVELMKQYFKDNHVFYKMRFHLSNKSNQACHWEDITGYAEVVADEIVYDKDKGFGIPLEGGNNEKAVRVPRQAAFDYYSTQRMGKWVGSDCESELEDKFEDAFYSVSSDNLIGDLPKFILNTAAMFTYLITFQFPNVITYGLPRPENVGVETLMPLSFLKVPMLMDKRGGGIRVKRLLMYADEMENGDVSLYGQEYLYEKEEDVPGLPGKKRKISSGVATNEPPGIREENALVSFLPRKVQSWYSRVTTGVNLDQSEGPIGESLLPGATICYSRVVVQNIARGAALPNDRQADGTGYSVHEFYTARDYPFDGMYFPKSEGSEPFVAELLSANNNNPNEATNLYDFGKNVAKGVEWTTLSANTQRDKLNIPTGLFNYKADQVWATQGYRFIMNSMHGRPKRTAEYGGKYDKAGFPVFSEQVGPLDDISGFYDEPKAAGMDLLKEERTEYFPPGRRVPYLKRDGTVGWFLPGKEMEVTTESVQLTERLFDLGIEIDAGATAALTLSITASFNFSISNSTLHTHALSKVIRYPALVRSVSSYQDGIYSKVENVLYDEMTGQAICTRSTDEYNQYVYSMNLPGHWYTEENGDYRAFTQQVLHDLDATHGFADSKNMVQTQVGSLTWYDDVDHTNGLKAFTEPGGSGPSDGYRFKAPSQILAATVSPYKKFPGNGSPSIPVPFQSWVYRAGLAPNTSAKASGYTEGPIEFFNFQTGPTTNKWANTTEVIIVDVNGKVLEEEDRLMNSSSGLQLGADGELPKVIGKNAQAEQLFFEDFETGGNSLSAHTGLKSYQISNSSPYSITERPLINGEYEVLFWAQNSTGESRLTSGISIDGVTNIAPIAYNGLWTLFKAITPQNFEGSITISPTSTAATMNIDDVLVRPVKSSTSAFVYDRNTQKLLARFDDQHFALLYKYDPSGKLVAKMKETERGVKTLSEAQYNTPRKPRNP